MLDTHTHTMYICLRVECVCPTFHSDDPFLDRHCEFDFALTQTRDTLRLSCSSQPSFNPYLTMLRDLANVLGDRVRSANFFTRPPSPSAPSSFHTFSLLHSHGGLTPWPRVHSTYGDTSRDLGPHTQSTSHIASRDRHVTVA